MHAGADTSVAVGGAVLTGLPVLQEDIGGTVGGGARAELGQVAFSERLSTHRARHPQLEREGEDTQNQTLTTTERGTMSAAAAFQSHFAVMATDAVG